jgi:hypothetical protein
MTARIIPVDTFDLVVFGGTGDLALRKLLPGLYYRDHDRQLPAGRSTAPPTGKRSRPPCAATCRPRTWTTTVSRGSSRASTMLRSTPAGSTAGPSSPPS